MLQLFQNPIDRHLSLMWPALESRWSSVEEMTVSAVVASAVDTLLFHQSIERDVIISSVDRPWRLFFISLSTVMSLRGVTSILLPLTIFNFWPPLMGYSTKRGLEIRLKK